jgi:hypothetical protein
MSLFDASGLEEWCRSADKELNAAFEWAHSHSTVKPLDRRRLRPAAAGRFLAVNAHSRIAVGRAMCAEIANALSVNAHWEHETPIFLGTLIPKAGLVAKEGAGIDLEEIKRRLRADLRGLSYLGSFEPAYYSSLPLSDQVPARQAICWHVHLLIWDVTAEQLAARMRKLRKKPGYVAVAAEFKAADAEQVANGELPGTVAYLLKPPSHAYRVTRYPWVGKDGEIKLGSDGNPKFYLTQRSSTLRRGERVRVFHAMKHLGMDDVIVAGGDGTALRLRALRAAGRELSHSQN